MDTDGDSGTTKGYVQVVVVQVWSRDEIGYPQNSISV